MTPLQPCLATDSILQIVFDHSAVYRPLKGDVTFEDVARMWARLARGRYADPVAFSIALGHAQMPEVAGRAQFRCPTVGHCSP